MRPAWIVACLTSLALWGCGQDPVAGTSGPAADASGQSPDLPLGDSPLPDTPLPDTPLPDTPAEMVDVAPTAVLPDWLTGAWLDCGSTLTLTAQGAWTWLEADGSCGAGGTASLSGATLDLSADPTTCVLPPWVKKGLGVARQGDVLTLLHTSYQGPRRLARGPIDRQRWFVQTDKGATAHLDLCFTATGAFYTGKWKSPNCGFLACGGVVDGLQVVGGAWQLWTHCAGDCACSGLIVAQTHTAEALSGTYSSASCMDASAGGFQAQPESLP